MSDLISRQAVLAWIQSQKEEVTKRQVAGSDGILTREVLVTMQRNLDTFENKIKQQPTAYDVEKVVEELGNQAEQYRQRGFEAETKGYSAMADKYYGKYCSYEHATEIVRKGGV